MAFNREDYADLYPFKGHTLELDGARMHYLDEGAGDPVVMVHGNPTWSFYFRKLVTELRTTHRVIVPDHLGCGLSDKPADSEYEYTLERRVSDLSRLIDSLKLTRKITLVVHDWGGMIGFAWATRNPERVARLVVLNTSAFRLPKTKRLPLTLRLVRDVAPFGAVAVRGFNAFAGLATRMAVRHRLEPRVAAGLTSPYDSWQNRIATLRFVQDIPLKPGDPSYDTVIGVELGLERLKDVPMLIGWGRHDFVFDDHFLAEWRQRFPKARVQVYEDAGHYVLEDAADRLVPLIGSFVR
jgi:haloalkane dehalogenase